MSEDFGKVKRKAEDALYKSETALANMAFGKFAERLKALESAAAEAVYMHSFAAAGAVGFTVRKKEGRLKLYCICDKSDGLSLSADGKAIALSGGAFAGELPSPDGTETFIVELKAKEACNALLIFRGAGVAVSV